MNKANECTCPSGDGSLVHPCPAHPAVEQVGGDERAAFEAAFAAMGRPVCRADYDQDAYGTPFDDGGWTGWQARAALAQPSPASDLDPFNLAPHAEAFNEAPAEALKPEPAEADRPEVVAWQYRVTAGPQTGWSLWHPGKGEEFERSYTVERRPLMTVAQHERIVGELRAVIAQLRQHKNDYMDSGQETYRALQNEIREREAEIARLDGLVSGRTAERDAAQARVAELEQSQGAEVFLTLTCEITQLKSKLAELEKQEPVAWVEVIDRDYGPYNFHGKRLLPKGKHQLYAAPVAQAQHSVPDGYALVPLEPTDDMLVAGQEAWTHKMERRGALEDCEEAGDVYRAMLAAAPGKEGV